MNNQPISGSKVILINEGKVLAFLRDDIPNIPFPGFWDLPGGAAESDEDYLECAKREVKEEFNVQPELKVLDILPSQVKEGHTMAIVYGKLSQENMENLQFMGEGQKWKFMDKNEIKNAKFVPHLRDYILNGEFT